MKYINLNLDFGVDRKQNPNIDSNSQLSIDWIGNAMQNGYRKGLSKEQRVCFVTVMDKLVKAGKEKANYIEINPIEEAFMKVGFDNTNVSPAESVWVTLVETAFTNATDTPPEFVPVVEPVSEPVNPASEVGASAVGGVVTAPSEETPVGPTPETVAPGTETPTA